MLFTLPRVFKQKLRCGNLLLRVHERYSDLSGGAAQAHDIGQDDSDLSARRNEVEAANRENNVQPR